ncbi:MAG: hypothetical protein PHD76_14700 [Methylacidiphilales bacterium]|nr:hypothetical protein [Candidatus Methylacidiphilales bacterium]
MFNQIHFYKSCSIGLGSLCALVGLGVCLVLPAAACYLLLMAGCWFALARYCNGQASTREPARMPR